MTDQWCEQQMWLDWGVNTGGREVFAASTGLVMCFVPFLYPTYKMTYLLYALQVNIIILGVGTFIFHWWPIDQYNNSIIAPLDWIPMIFTLANLLFISNYVFFNKYNLCMHTVSMLLVIGWIFTLFYIMNFGFNVWISELLLVAPPVFFLLYLSCFVDLHEAWLLLFLCLGIWLTNRFACKAWSVLGSLHAIWHVIIGYALWDIGVTLTNFY